MHQESLFERALDAVVGMDDAGRVTAWNPAAEEIFGWSRDEALGQSMGDLIVPHQHRQAHANGLKHFNRTGEGPVLEKRIKITALHRSGREFPVELSIFPMREDDGRRCFYGFLRSLEAEETHRREQERRAQEAEILLAIAQKLLEDTSTEEFAQFCLEKICQVAGLDAGHFLVVRGVDSRRFLQPTGAWFVSEGRFQPVVDATASYRFALGEGLPGRAWKQGELVVQQDLATDPNFPRRDVFTGVGLTRGMAMPIRHGGATHGVLEFFGSDTSRFDPEIIRLVRTVGTQIGVALRRKEMAEQRETLRREIAHRVGNSLAVVTSIFRVCARTARSVEELKEGFLGRILAVGRATRLSMDGPNHSVPLQELVQDAISLLPEAESIPVDVPDLEIDSNSVMPLSLILNELATNGIKHGSLGSAAALSIRGGTCPESGDLYLHWQESLTAPRLAAEAQSGTGFGSQLLDTMIKGRLGGSFERQVDESGFRMSIRLPLAQL